MKTPTKGMAGRDQDMREFLVDVSDAAGPSQDNSGMTPKLTHPTGGLFYCKGIRKFGPHFLGSLRTGRRLWWMLNGKTTGTMDLNGLCFGQHPEEQLPSGSRRPVSIGNTL